MELKKFVIFLVFIFFSSSLRADLIEPSQKLDSYNVVKIQLEALKKNNKQDQGIRQTWLFAHPDNRKVTGPYEKFKAMIYGQQYRYLINHTSHKIKLITNSPNTFVYRVEIVSKEKKLFFYEWHVQKGSDDRCTSCWFTSAVSMPIDQGNTI